MPTYWTNSRAGLDAAVQEAEERGERVIQVINRGDQWLVVTHPARRARVIYGSGGVPAGEWETRP